MGQICQISFLIKPIIIIVLLCGVSELTKQQLSCHTAAMTEMGECDFTVSARSMYNDVNT